MEKIADLQKIFWEAIKRGAVGQDELGFIDERGPLTAEERVGIYSDAYAIRLYNVLASDFPALRACLGEKDFAMLAENYVNQHFSTNASLRYFGERLSAFAGARFSATHPWAEDLAAFEWAKIEAFDGPDEKAVTLGELAMIDQRLWPDLRFRISSNLRLIETSFNLDELDPPGSGMPVRLHKSRTIKVWRKNEDIYVGNAVEEEVTMMRLVDNGFSLGRLAAEMAGQAGDDVSERIFAILSKWIEDEILAEASLD